jgi:hypothetical protein
MDAVRDLGLPDSHRAEPETNGESTNRSELERRWYSSSLDPGWSASPTRQRGQIQPQELLSAEISACKGL